MKKEYRYYIYIVSNFNRTTYYTGLTNNILRRIIEHREGFGSNFTKKYSLKYLVYYEYYRYIDQAINREKEIKKWRREKKIALISEINPEQNDLSAEIFDSYGINKNNYKEILEDIKNLSSRADARDL
ncbi:hypothetical protein C0583_02020 [Candidatus Parcubacteria bacterium]|nr:MAG: hypothetical protein C0583_02020 [Candidatus Parcubacteria bacterium]